MSSIGTGYDLSASQFSPDGRVFQIEYATKSVENSGTSIGLRGRNGVVLAVEKLIPNQLYEDDCGSRIHNVDVHIGLAVCGMIADGNHIADIARQEASSYKQQFNRLIPLQILNDRLSSYLHAYTLYSAVRPFGVSVIICSYSKENGPEMYMIDPSGVSSGYFGCAMGKAKQAAKTEIEKINLGDVSMEDLLINASKIIYQLHDDLKDKEFKLELSWVSDQTNERHQVVPPALYKKCNEAGKTALKDGGSSDEDEPK
ncbi:proteasome subunit alpha type-3 [Lutzomyia longipalpis]|uniref:Proteasome subunit alpha type n=1 Tax=Lutzomyia longipalpis TaxID=7200 RepID=A0A7G3ATK7_LUTLO|nr:proteasome subunit alpha type-3 [Lutzomyia longipalpis]